MPHIEAAAKGHLPKIEEQILRQHKEGINASSSLTCAQSSHDVHSLGMLALEAILCRPATFSTPGTIEHRTDGTADNALLPLPIGPTTRELDHVPPTAGTMENVSQIESMEQQITRCCRFPVDPEFDEVLSAGSPYRRKYLMNRLIGIAALGGQHRTGAEAFTTKLATLLHMLNLPAEHSMWKKLEHTEQRMEVEDEEGAERNGHGMDEGEERCTLKVRETKGKAEAERKQELAAQYDDSYDALTC